MNRYDAFEKSYKERPHVVIIGAGASVAAIPNGDKNGLKTSVMDGFLKKLGIEETIKNLNLGTKSENLEDIYSELFEKDEYTDIRNKLDEEIRKYFSKFEIPDEPIIYDFLILSLREKDLIASFPNAIYLGTFSKAYALGGMRVGYGIAQPEIINAFYKLRAPFNITTLTLAAAIEALKDEEFVTSCIAKNFEEMTRYEEYAKERGFEYIPSYTNFITIKFGDKFVSKVVAQKLLERGVIVRDLTGYGQNAIRITIGRNEQNTKVFEQLDEVLEKLK